jgi:hypothetical protein
MIRFMNGAAVYVIVTDSFEPSCAVTGSVALVAVAMVTPNAVIFETAPPMIYSVSGDGPAV